MYSCCETRKKISYVCVESRRKYKQLRNPHTFLSPYINGKEFDILVRFVEERKETILIHNIITLVLSFYEEYFEILLINIYLQMVPKVALTIKILEGDYVVAYLSNLSWTCFKRKISSNI